MKIIKRDMPIVLPAKAGVILHPTSTSLPPIRAPRKGGSDPRERSFLPLWAVEIWAAFWTLMIMLIATKLYTRMSEIVP